MDVPAMREKLAEANRLIHEVYGEVERVDRERLYWGAPWEVAFYLDKARRQLRLAEIKLADSEDPRNANPMPRPKRIVRKKSEGR